MWNFSWQKSAILTEIDSNNKIIAAENHRKRIELLQQNYSENIIIYFDDSKQDSYAGAAAYISYSNKIQQQYYWHLHSILKLLILSYLQCSSLYKLQKLILMLQI